MLGELAGEDESDGGLDLAGGDGGLLVVAGELGGLAGELLEDVVDEAVQDAHGLAADARVGVHLRTEFLAQLLWLDPLPVSSAFSNCALAARHFHKRMAL